MRVLFLFPYPLKEAASQRFRFEQYLHLLEQNNIQIETHAFLSNNAWKKLYQPGHYFSKFLRILNGYIKRFFLLFTLSKFSYVFIHREAAPLGPPIFEFLIAKIFRKKIVYDFDDAIWLKNYSEANKFFSAFKFYTNTKYICKWAYKVSCGNEYLCNFAKQYNKNVVYNPTTIDTENHHNKVKQHQKGKFVIGWTGSHSTNRYLMELYDVMADLEKKYEFEFLVISDESPELDLKSFRFIKWNKSSEIEDLLKMDVGIMPLKDDLWANGKCGFKALQYMSLGIPALVSPVGVNTKIVDHGINGFICSSEQDWFNHLEKLLLDANLLQEISKATRQKIENYYSVKSNSQNFIHLFS
ncbi:MAG: glycosyltransferase family 4 protein [Bacteroidota bacterium]